jgi:hypothetical protein
VDPATNALAFAPHSAQKTASPAKAVPHRWQYAGTVASSGVSVVGATEAVAEVAGSVTDTSREISVLAVTPNAVSVSDPQFVQKVVLGSCSAPQLLQWSGIEDSSAAVMAGTVLTSTSSSVAIGSVEVLATMGSSTTGVIGVSTD